MSGWKKVVFGHEIGPDDACPQCGGSYIDCPCPGPTMEGWIYRWRDGSLWAREEELADMVEDLQEQIGKLVYAGIGVDMDLAITEGPTGKPLLHIASCPDCRQAAARGEFVGTLFGCQGPLPDDIEKHSCMGVTADPAHSAAE